MGYSLKESDFSKAKQGAEFTYFPDEEWSRYPFASEQDAKWFREAKYGENIFATRGGIWKPTKRYASCFKGNHVYLHILSSAPVATFTLPFKNNALKAFSCLTREKVSLKSRGGKLRVTVFGRKNGKCYGHKPAAKQKRQAC